MDVSSPTAIARLIVPKLPFIFATTVYHTLGLSPMSARWDLRTEITVGILRRVMENEKPIPLSRQQAGSKKDPGIKGKMWVSKITLPAPDAADVRDILCQAIEDMRETGRETFTTPPTLPVEGEWIGYRVDATARSARPDFPEELHYKYLMTDAKSDTTILYMHGGALVGMDPATHRVPCSNLARLTRGRCFSVRYRLAPQNPFPAALLDILVTYLSLINPPPGAYHKPVSAQNIVFAGDSAGGTLSFALLQLLLQINRTAIHLAQPSIRFHDHEVSLPLPIPGGVATTSAWLDLTRCMPSVAKNYPYDYLPRVHPEGRYVHFPHDNIWPTDPPRNDLYCDSSMLCHPLASPMRSASWEGACPMFLGCGQEMLTDENKAVAATAANQGVPVMWQEYEAMPHCGCMFFMDGPMGKQYFANWAGFCSQATRGEIHESKGSWFENKSLKEVSVDVKSLAVCSDEEMRRLMDDSRGKREAGLETETKTMPKL